MTVSDRAIPPTIPHLAQAAAQRWPDVPAVIERGRTVTFAQLWQAARDAAASMASKGMTRGGRVAIWAPNSYEWIVVALGAMTLGAAIVPLNTRLKGAEAAALLRRTRATMLFTTQGFLGIDYHASLEGQHLPDLATTILLDRDLAEFLEPRGSDDASSAVDRAMALLCADDVCDILFTSGTTGEPKGVLTTHGRLLPQCADWIARTGLVHGDRYLIANPFFHAFGTKVGWVACLMVGAAALPMAQFDVDEAARLIDDHGVTFLPGPPTIFQMLLDRNERAPFATRTLRGGTTGAATVPPTLIARIRDELGMTDLVTAYGMTECTVITCCRPSDSVDTIAATCGQPIEGNSVRIVGDDGVDLPAGEPGEVLVRGPGVMLGYLDDPEATARAIDEDGWLATGDIGVLDSDGYLSITDRKKDMYISGGFNVYPAEVEKQLAAHPQIAQVAVVGVPHDRLGEVGRAFVVPRGDSRLDAAALHAWARERIANYKLPQTFEFLPELPVNAGGKVIKDALRRSP